ncbi:MAG TPA: 8-amino-7-oxononanoate synthase [Pirellulaceae bacterium]|jgi:8-amino-7-oxononanoate synthase
MPHPLDWLDDALADLDRRGLRRQLRATFRHPPAAEIEVAGQSLINFGSNDYLGLASDPRIATAVKEAIDQYGWGAGASPLITGRSDLHVELERDLANFEGTEAALLFPTGYSANVGTIAALIGKEDAVFSDQLNHASIIDGCRLSGAKIHIYPNSHCSISPLQRTNNNNGSLLPGTLGTPNREAGRSQNKIYSSLLPGTPGRRAGDEGPSDDVMASRDNDLTQLRQMLASDHGPGRKLIVTDAIFSMHGTVAPVLALVELAREFNAMLMVDEAHAIGVLGDRGAGLCQALHCESQVNLRIGTLSKALGGHGGFVTGSRRLIDWISNRARPYIFSTAAPPAVAAAGLAALEIVRTEPERKQSLDQNAVELRRQLLDRNLIQPTSRTHIIPILLGQPDRAVAASAELRRRGFYVPAIRPPSVPIGQSLLRISLTCSHTDEHIEGLIAALHAVCAD